MAHIDSQCFIFSPSCTGSISSEDLSVKFSYILYLIVIASRVIKIKNHPIRVVFYFYASCIYFSFSA